MGIIMQMHRYRQSIAFILVISLLALFTPSVAHADGGAPNLAYVSGTSKGVSVIDVAQQKVTSTITVPGDPHYVSLSADGRFLYATEPQSGRFVLIAAKTGETICTANVPVNSTLLALDGNIVFVAGSSSSTITAINTTDCSIKRAIQTDSPVYGMFIAAVGSSVGGGTGNQLWVSNTNAVSIFDDQSGKKTGQVNIPGGPQYITIPPGATVYVTTHQGTVVAIDLNVHTITPLVSGGIYGPMDYDQTTGEVYVPDQKNDRLVVLTPVNSGFAAPKEPARTLSLSGVKPESVAITSDGQLGFVALDGGNVAMLDVPGHQVINTIYVGGNPHFVITGLYPPVVGTTPQQANTYITTSSIIAYLIVALMLIVPILLFRRYANKARARINAGEVRVDGDIKPDSDIKPGV